MALKYLKNNKKVSAKELAMYMNAPFDPLSRVMQKLGRSGFIESEKGAGGGYRMNFWTILSEKL